MKEETDKINNLMTFEKEFLNNKEKYVQGMASALFVVAKHLIDYEEFLKNIEKNAQTILRTILSSLQNSPISEEDKKKIIKLAESYSNFGVPDPFNDSWEDIKNKTIDEKRVNEICEKYSKGKNFEIISNALYELEFANEQQIGETLECFNNSNFYLCCSGLFAIIERELISSQPIKEEKRKAFDAKFISNQIENLNNNFKSGRLYFRQLSLIKILKNYFKNGGDFKDESIEKYPIINRNFLLHGMTNRHITKEDCVKLFLFVYHLKTQKNILIENVQEAK